MREPNPAAGRVALITGASSGVGRATAVSLSRVCEVVHLVGRDAVRLGQTAAAATKFSKVIEWSIDLIVEDNLEPLVRQLEESHGRLDILVHSAGVFIQNPLEQAKIQDLDHQYTANVRAPYLLTQRLLPLLAAAQGQVVFINSSAAVTAKRPEIGQYAASKHALKAIADSLREEVNSKGIRVLTVYLGRTATPMQEAIHKLEGRAYTPETLLQPDDIATMVVQALMLPRTAEVTDISIRPMRRM